MSDAPLPEWLDGAFQSPLYGGRYNRKQMIDAIEGLVTSRHGVYSRSVAQQIFDLFRNNPPRHSSMNLEDAEPLGWGDGVFGLKLAGQENIGPGHSHSREFVVFFGRGDEAKANRALLRAALDAQETET